MDDMSLELADLNARVSKLTNLVKDLHNEVGRSGAVAAAGAIVAARFPELTDPGDVVMKIAEYVDLIQGENYKSPNR